MMRLLIATDGSVCSNAAIDDLTRAGIPPDSEAVVVSVGETWLPIPTRPVTTEVVGQTVLVRQVSDLAVAAAQRVRSIFPSWTVRAETRSGSPAREVLELAGRLGVDLVVLGSHGRTGLAKFILGSVSQRVASSAECSVRIARGRPGARGPVRVLVGHDGSPGAEFAVRAVAGRTWPPGSCARIATAIGPLAIDGHELGGELEHAYTFHEPARLLLETAGLTVSSAVRDDDPRQFVVREASEWNADSIFVGASGFVTLDRFLFGTVVAAVAARAHCSVEVIRPPRR